MDAEQMYFTLVEIVSNFIQGEDYFNRAIKRQVDFSRLRKMSFHEYIYAILLNVKYSLQAGLYLFFAMMKKGQMDYSKQAFSKGRQRIKPEAIKELYELIATEFYKRAVPHTWNGYQLFGIDGTRLNLPCTDKLAELYGTQVSQGTPQVQALVSCVYDLYNEMIVDTRFAPCKSSERDAAKEMIEAFKLDNVVNPVFIMDRGYPSGELMDAIIQAGKKFIIRCPQKFFPSELIPQADNTFTHKFEKLDHPLKLRVVKFKIHSNDKDDEYLVTNLFDDEISLENFKNLYRERWDIETRYNAIKNKLEIENFTGKLPDAILQDFYATMFLTNMSSALLYDYRDQIEAAHANPENKYKYKMNIAATISATKQTVVEMLSTPSKKRRQELLDEISQRLMKAVVPERPNRSFPRKRVHMSMKFPQNMKTGI